MAFSGGVDSAYLAIAAPQCLGRAGAGRHRRQSQLPGYASSAGASAIAREFGFAHEMIHTDELSGPSTGRIRPTAATTARTSSYGRLAAHRRAAWHSQSSPTATTPTIEAITGPGRQAAREHGVRSPLDEADLTKDEIRALAREAGIETLG